MAGYHEACLSSTPFSIDPDSLEDEETPVIGSPAVSVSVTPSWRGSHSFEVVNQTPVRQMISPPPFWCPSPWSPSHSAPDLRRAAAAGAAAAVAVPCSTRLAATGPLATSQARVKSPFWVASTDNVQPQGQTQYGASAAEGAAGGQHQQLPPGSGDRQDPAIRNREGMESVSPEHSSARSGSPSSWWLVPLVVLGACAGLLLLAVAALGTTYTYRSVIARIAAAEKAATKHIARLYA